MSTMSRLERESVRRRLAQSCPPHPKNRVFWQEGDFGTPDRLVCGRCWAQLARRTHQKQKRP